MFKSIQLTFSNKTSILKYTKIFFIQYYNLLFPEKSVSFYYPNFYFLTTHFYCDNELIVILFINYQPLQKEYDKMYRNNNSTLCIV